MAPRSLAVTQVYQTMAFRQLPANLLWAATALPVFSQVAAVVAEGTLAAEAEGPNPTPAASTPVVAVAVQVMRGPRTRLMFSISRECARAMVW